MRPLIVFFILLLPILADTTKANDNYLEKVLKILEKYSLSMPVKNQLAEKINDDLCKRMASKKKLSAVDIPDFLYTDESSNIKGKGFYQVNYHINIDNEVEFESCVSQDENTDNESIELLELSRPINFDFSTLSEQEILNDLKPELDKTDTPDELKKAMLPLLRKDLQQKLGDPEEDFTPPRFLGGTGDYIVEFYRFDSGKIEIDTDSFDYQQKDRRECSIDLKMLQQPLDFDYSTITKEKIEEKVKEILAKKTLKQDVRDLLLPEIVKDLQERINEAKGRHDVPYFLGGTIPNYHISYYENGEEGVSMQSSGFSSYNPSNSSYNPSNDSIILTKLSGPLKIRFL